jgi:hypothetical protein
LSHVVYVTREINSLRSRIWRICLLANLLYICRYKNHPLVMSSDVSYKAVIVTACTAISVKSSVPSELPEDWQLFQGQLQTANCPSFMSKLEFYMFCFRKEHSAHCRNLWSRTLLCNEPFVVLPSPGKRVCCLRYSQATARSYCVSMQVYIPDSWHATIYVYIYLSDTGRCGHIIL